MITLRSSPCAPGSTLPPQSQCEVRSATSPALRRCGSHIKQLIPSLWCRLPHPTISASAQSNHEFPVNANPLSHWSDADSKDADGHEQQRPWWRKRPALPGLVGAMAALALLASPPEAAAVLNSPNAQIARTADAALRRSIPASNPEVKEIQKSLEDIAYLLRIPQRKPFGTMANDLQNALRRFESRDRLLEGVPADKGQEAAETLDTLYSSLKRLELAIKSQQGDYIGLRVGEALKVTAELELLQAPGLPYVLPKDYQTLPRLIGRSVVELEVERDGALAFVDNVNGGLSSTATIQITLDGYSAPISSGRFLDNILSGRYNDRRIEASRSAVVAPSPSATQVPPVPLEILPLGEFDPVYRLPLDVQGGELPVLPLSINGAVSFTHVPGSDSYLDGDAFFMYKFDKQSAGLAGLAFDEGSFAVFGYVTRGVDVMDSLKSGDRIIRATVLSGADKLIKPSGSA